MNLLSTHIGSRKNSLDLIRLISAALVIVGHSYAIVGLGVDPMAKWNGSVYSGLFALHVFFFISGMLVTNSFLHKPDIVSWGISRALRILPALFVCLVVTVFVLGALNTTLRVTQYLTHHQTWDYFLGNLLLLQTRFFLPGVFAGNVEKGVNGPLWSLFLEVRLYACAAVLLWIFRGRPRQWLTAALGAIAILGLVFPRWLFVFGETENNITCSVLFLLGALCALWSDKVLISNLWLAVIFLAANSYIWTQAFAPLFLIFTCYFVLCFAFSRFLSAIHLPGDYSYGLYIYGWPVQQVVAKWFPHWAAPQNAAASLVGAMALAALSWHLIEKPSLAKKAIVSGAPSRQPKRAVAVAVVCALLLIMMGAGLHMIGSGSYEKPVEGPKVADNPKAADSPNPGEQLGVIEAFGPRQVVAGKPFNVQGNGSSAMWVQLPSSANAKSFVVFRSRKLETVVSGKLLTASVPNELLASPGEVDIYVVDESYTPPRRTSSSRMTVLNPAN
jgi:peptidoglycan/LPS O-acetylase OafA/YrhL